MYVYICICMCVYRCSMCICIVCVCVVSIRLCIYALTLRIRDVSPFYEAVTDEARGEVSVCVCVRVNCLDLSRRVASSRSSCRRAARKFTVQIFFVCLFSRMAKRAGYCLLLSLFLFGLLFLLCFYFSFATSLPLPLPLCLSLSLSLS